MAIDDPDGADRRDRILFHDSAKAADPVVIDALQLLRAFFALRDDADRRRLIEYAATLATQSPEV